MPLDRRKYRTQMQRQRAMMRDGGQIPACSGKDLAAAMGVVGKPVIDIGIDTSCAEIAPGICIVVSSISGQILLDTTIDQRWTGAQLTESVSLAAPLPWATRYNLLYGAAVIDPADTIGEVLRGTTTDKVQITACVEDVLRGRYFGFVPCSSNKFDENYGLGSLLCTYDRIEKDSLGCGMAMVQIDADGSAYGMLWGVPKGMAAYFRGSWQRCENTLVVIYTVAWKFRTGRNHGAELSLSRDLAEVISDFPEATCQKINFSLDFASYADGRLKLLDVRKDVNQSLPQSIFGSGHLMCSNYVQFQEEEEQFEDQQVKGGEDDARGRICQAAGCMFVSEALEYDALGYETCPKDVELVQSQLGPDVPGVWIAQCLRFLSGDIVEVIMLLTHS